MTYQNTYKLNAPKSMPVKRKVMPTSIRLNTPKYMPVNSGRKVGVAMRTKAPLNAARTTQKRIRLQTSAPVRRVRRVR